MKKEMNNKGFSLVELIIVIAIMAVLIGVLAPQYLKYVKQSKISTDITNAEEVATAINTAVADEEIAFSSITLSGGSGSTIYTDGSKTVSYPECKTQAGKTWVVDADATNGVKTITLGGASIWPNASEFRSTAQGW